MYFFNIFKYIKNRNPNKLAVDCLNVLVYWIENLLEHVVGF